MISSSFHCYLVTKDSAGKTQAEVAKKALVNLPAGEVLIRVAYSALNYKDALSATGHPGVTRSFPHVPGIDVAGTVAESSSPMVQVGEEVFVTGFDLGQNTWGGFSEFCRVPAAWVMHVPDGLTLREVMTYGTAGLTAAQCIEALALRGIEPGHGEVVVTGASGGVGSMAVAILARIGYRVVAVTGKRNSHPFLFNLGAQRIIGREEVNDTTRKALLPVCWAGAIDTVGGNTLSTLLRATEHDGCVAACGLVGGTDLPMTVYPFIIRGVTLAGVDSAECRLETRARIWRKLSAGWKPKNLDSIASQEINLGQLDGAIKQIFNGQTTGRVLVRPEADDDEVG